MSRATKIRTIVIHCTAGHTSAEKVQAYFLRPKAQGGRGWNTGGYHIIIEKDGSLKEMYPFETVTNGVGGYNSQSIHISYVGGVDPNNVYKAVDTRTAAQKAGIHTAIQRAITWLKANGKDITRDLAVVGHYDFSKDKNGNGTIESYERIKECPSFDVMQELNRLYSSPDRYGKLPYAV